MVTHADSSTHLLPAKFILIVLQILILIVVLLTKDRFIYWDVGTNYSKTSANYI
jgi:hypothetical protein